MQDKIKQINQLVEQVNKAASLLIDVLELYQVQERPRVARRARDRRERCRCLDYCYDSLDDDNELNVVVGNATERESRRHRRADGKRDRSRSRGRSRGHSRGRSHGRSRSRSHTNAAHRRMSLALQV